MVLSLEPGLTGQADVFSVAGWQVDLGEGIASTFVHPASERRFSAIQFQLSAQRDPRFYQITMLAPLALIVLMSWTSFWIDPGRLEAQVAITTASAFTIIAFRITLRSALPAVPYMTRADLFVFGCTLLVFGALGQAVWTGRLAERNRHDFARRLDRWARWS